MSETHPDISRLSFVAARDGKTLPKPKGNQLGRCFWHVKSSGDYGKDCVNGRALALEYLALEEEDSDGPGFLQLIVADMLPRKLTGIEVGFLTMVSYAAGAGAERARRISAYRDSCRTACAFAGHRNRPTVGATRRPFSLAASLE